MWCAGCIISSPMLAHANDGRCCKPLQALFAFSSRLEAWAQAGPASISPCGGRCLNSPPSPDRTSIGFLSYSLMSLTGSGMTISVPSLFDPSLISFFLSLSLSLASLLLSPLNPLSLSLSLALWHCSLSRQDVSKIQRM